MTLGSTRNGIPFLRKALQNKLAIPCVARLHKLICLSVQSYNEAKYYGIFQEMQRHTKFGEETQMEMCNIYEEIEGLRVVKDIQDELRMIDRLLDDQPKALGNPVKALDEEAKERDNESLELLDYRIKGPDYDWKTKSHENLIQKNRLRRGKIKNLLELAKVVEESVC